MHLKLTIYIPVFLFLYSCIPISIRTPNPSWSPPPLLLLPYDPPSCFIHRLQTSITQSFIKLECFLRPFLKLEAMTNLHIHLDPVSDFWKCPKKFFFSSFFLLNFLTSFFDTFGLIGSVKTFSKVLRVGMNVGPYMAYILYI